MILRIGIYICTYYTTLGLRDPDSDHDRDPHSDRGPGPVLTRSQPLTRLESSTLTFDGFSVHVIFYLHLSATFRAIPQHRA